MRILPFLLSTVLAVGIWPATITGAETLTSPDIGMLNEWALDEAHQQIYAASQGKLQFIRTDNLSMIKQLDIGAHVSDLKLANQKIYLAAHQAKQIFQVNPETQSIEKTIKTQHVPYQIAIDGDKLFYVEDDQWSYLYEINLTSGEERQIELPIYSQYHDADLAVDPAHHILYIGDSGHSTNNLEAISTLDYQRLHKSIESDGFEHDYPLRHVLIDGDSVYYAKQRYRANNIAVVEGDYREPIIYAKGNYVFSENGVFDRDRYIKLKGFPKTKHILMDEAENIYLFSDTEHTIKKVRLGLELPPQTNHQRLAHRLALGVPLTDWAYDDQKKMIYAISENANQLLYIRAHDLEVVREKYVGSRPTDLELFNGKIYIGLHGATKAAVVGTELDSPVETLTLHSFPYRIAVDQDQLFYVGKDQHRKLGVYDFATGQAGQLDIVLTLPTNPDSFYQPDLLMNREKGLLYVGEYGSSGSTLYAIGTKDHLLKDKHGDFSFPERGMVLAGSDVYYAGTVWDGRQLSRNVAYYGSGVLDIRFPYVLKRDEVYQALSGQTVALPVAMSLAAVNEEGNLFFYSGEEQMIYQFDSVEDLEQLKNEMLGDPLGSYLPMDTENHWAEKMIQDFIFADTIKGYVDDEGHVYARPNHPITRAEFVTILVRALGLESTQAGKRFADVYPGQWYAEPIRIASSLGIVNGISENQFAPGRAIRRDEIAALVVKAFGKSIDFAQGSPKSFRDVPSYWAAPFIDQASRVGIIGGYSGSLFKPTAHATRAEAVTMLYHAFEKEQGHPPSDSILTEAVLGNERANQRLAEEQKWNGMYGVNETYGTGFYRAYANLNSDQIMALLAEGYEVEVELKGQLSAKVLEKSDRYATVQLDGAVYEMTLRKDGTEKKAMQDASGIVRLKKGRDGTWKMYSFE